MRLPAKLRLMLFRDSLMDKQPLLDRRLYEAKKPDETAEVTESTCDIPATEGDSSFFLKVRLVSGYGLNPAILQAGQQPYAEGRPVLYAENTIRLRVCFSAEAALIINQGNIVALPPRSISLQAHDMGQYTDDMRLLREEEIEFASCFKSFHIALYTSQDRNLTQLPRLALRCLTPAMTGSTVGVHVHEMKPVDEASILGFSKVFHLIRCKALNFIGLSETTTSQSKHIVATATGSSPVVDLGEQLDQIWAYPSLRYLMCGGYDKEWFGFMGWVIQRLHALEAAAMDCNSGVFCKIISEIILEVDKEFQAIRRRLNMTLVLDFEYNATWEKDRPLLEHHYQVQLAAVQEKYAAALNFLKEQLGTEG